MVILHSFLSLYNRPICLRPVLAIGCLSCVIVDVSCLGDCIGHRCSNVMVFMDHCHDLCCSEVYMVSEPVSSILLGRVSLGYPYHWLMLGYCLALSWCFEVCSFTGCNLLCMVNCML